MKKMILFFTASVLMLGATPIHAGTLSGFEALFAIGRAKGNKILANVVSLHSSDAAPQPTQWTVTFKDSEARGGVREFVVNDKGIAGERTPLQVSDAASSGVMPASTLKVDSTSVFTTVNAAAVKDLVRFDTLNYHLRNVDGVPIWKVRLMDLEGNEVGTVSVSAKDGSILTPLKATPVTPSIKSDAKPSATPTVEDNTRPLGQRWVEGGGLVGHMDRWSRRAWETTSDTAERTWKTTSDTTGRVGDSIGAFFTGRPPQETKPGN